MIHMLFFAQDVCTEAAQMLKISPVALDFFTLVSADGRHFLNPNKVLNEAECTSQVYLFRLCIKACHGLELRDIDKGAFEYYFYQVCCNDWSLVLHLLTNIFTIFFHFYLLNDC